MVNDRDRDKVECENKVMSGKNIVGEIKVLVNKNGLKQ